MGYVVQGIWYGVCVTGYMVQDIGFRVKDSLV
jgi:hypothetical protein